MKTDLELFLKRHGLSTAKKPEATNAELEEALCEIAQNQSDLEDALIEIAEMLGGGENG